MPDSDPETAPHDPDDRRLIFAIGAAHRRLRRALAARMPVHGASPAQAGVLFALAHADGRPAGEIAAEIDVAPSVVTGLVDRMQEGGLVERSRSAVDGRGTLLRLTPAGRRVQEELSEAVGALNSSLAEGFTDQEIATVMRFLHAIRRRTPSD